MSAQLVHSSDGTAIAIEHAGPAGAPAVVLLHGIAQSRHSYRSVLDGPLADELHLVALDLRGHGDSQAPPGDAFYAAGDRLGADVKAVIDALGLVRPILVGWSYGGVVIGEYLRHHGAGALGGVLFIAAAVKIGKPARGLLGPVMIENGRALVSDDPAVYEAGARTFLAGCTAQPLPQAVLDEQLAAMLRVPAHVRRALLSRSEDFTPELAACTVPVATFHGTADRVVLPTMSEHIAASCTTSTSFTVDGVGHLPWLESATSAATFEEALRALVARARD